MSVQPDVPRVLKQVVYLACMLRSGKARPRPRSNQTGILHRSRGLVVTGGCNPLVTSPALVYLPYTAGVAKILHVPATREYPAVVKPFPPLGHNPTTSQMYDRDPYACLSTQSV